MKKISFLLIVVLCFTFLTGVVSANEKNPHDTIKIAEEIPVAEFINSNPYAVKSEKALSYSAEKVTVTYRNSRLYIYLILQDKQEEWEVSIESTPMEGKYDSIDGRVVIGDVVNVTDKFEVVNLRIEETAENLTLMPMNLDLEGKTILSLGVKKDGDIYYFQHELKDFDFSGLFESAQNNTDILTDEEKRELEEQYLFMGSDLESESEEVTISLDEMNENTLEENEEVESLLEYLNDVEEKGEVSSPDLPITRGVVHSKVPDSIFKSGAFGKWNHKHASTYCYSYITYQYAGTQNRESHIVMLEVMDDTATSPHKVSLKVMKNMNVLYNIYNKKIYAKNENRVHVNNLKLKLKSNVQKGVFISRKYWGVNQKNTLKKVSEAGLLWTKYAGKITNTYKKLSGDDLNANKEFPYQTSYEKQMDLHGKVISSIDAKCVKLRYPNDYFSLQGKGSKMTSCTGSYSYTVQYK